MQQCIPLHPLHSGTADMSWEWLANVTRPWIRDHAEKVGYFALLLESGAANTKWELGYA